MVAHDVKMRTGRILYKDKACKDAATCPFGEGPRACSTGCTFSYRKAAASVPNLYGCALADVVLPDSCKTKPVHNNTSLIANDDDANDYLYVTVTMYEGGTI